MWFDDIIKKSQMNRYRSITFRWVPILINVSLLGFLIFVHIRLYQYAFDDAFIHFRVVRNLVETGSPYYNAQEMLKVSTSSGWIVFLTVPYGISKLFNADNNFPLLISILNAFILFCGLYIYTKITEELMRNRLSLASRIIFQISFIALLLPSSIGLMETPLALLVAGAGIYALLISKQCGFALLGFAACLRLELLLLLFLTILFEIYRRQFRLRNILGYSMLGLMPFVLFDMYFYHTVVPHSMISKSIIYSITPLNMLVNFFYTSFPILPNLIYLGITSITLVSIFILTSWASFREKSVRKMIWPSMFCLASLGTAGAYILAHTKIFDWYIPLYMIPILLACFICSLVIDFPRSMIIKIPLYGMFLISAVFLLVTFYAGARDPGAFFLFESGSRVKSYLMVGKILNAAYPNATLLSSEIGGLGYSFHGKILDAAGLASSDALPFHPMKVPEQRAGGNLGAIPPGYVKATMPDIIVSYDIFAQALLNDEIISQYHVIVLPAYLPEDSAFAASKTIWGSEHLRVYIKNSLLVSEKIRALGQ
jgi:hypothetical protein